MATMQDIIKKYNLENLGGSDNFDNNKFDARKWSAPIIQDPKILKEYLDASGIVGATIKEIAIVNDDMFGVNIITSNFISTDEFYIDGFYNPIIIVTDKGNFEIDYSESSTVRISKNCLIHDMYASENLKKYKTQIEDIRKIFMDLAGKQIVDFSINEQDFFHADCDFTCSYGIGLDSEQKSYIKELIFILNCGKKLVFINDFDDATLYLLDIDKDTGFKNW